MKAKSNYLTNRFPYLLCFLFLVTGCYRYPLTPGSQWIGSYTCSQGLTDLQVNVIGRKMNQLDAIFIFNHEASGARGSFYLKGEYNPENRELNFTPGDWIVRPSCYMTVGMSGKVLADPPRFEGRITHPSCGTFSIKLAP